MADLGGVDAGEGRGDGVDRRECFVEDACGEVADFFADGFESVAYGVEGGVAAVHDLGHGSDGVAGFAELAFEIGEEGQEFGSGFAKDSHGGCCALGGVVDRLDARRKDFELLGGKFAFEFVHGDAHGGEGIGGGAGAVAGVLDVFLHFGNRAADFVGADAGIVEGALEDEELACRLAGGGREVGEAAAEVEGVGEALDRAAHGGEGGIEDGGEGFGGDLPKADASNKLSKPHAALLAHFLALVPGVLDVLAEFADFGGRACGLVADRLELLLEALDLAEALHGGFQFLKGEFTALDLPLEGLHLALDFLQAVLQPDILGSEFYADISHGVKRPPGV